MDSSTPFRLPRKTPFGIGENVAEWATGLSQLDKFYAQRPANADTKLSCDSHWISWVSTIALPMVRSTQCQSKAQPSLWRITLSAVLKA